MFIDTFQTKPYLRFALAAAAVWTVGAVVSLGWNLSNTHKTVENAARTAARASYEKDMVYRAWSSRHGRVYVPVDDLAVPNPFLGDLPGLITIRFQDSGDEEVTLIVSDDGVGLSGGFDLDKTASLGLKLVHNIVGQLGGGISLGGAPGVTWTITCPIYYGAGGSSFVGSTSRKI